MKNLPTYVFSIVAFCVIALIVILCVYGVNFNGEISDNQAIWGAFGDFVGGTLNPIFSFLGLIALLLTIVLQSRELEETRNEISRSAEAHEQQLKYISGQQQRDDLIRLVTKLTDRINNNYNSNIAPGASIHGVLIGGESPLTNNDLFILTDEMNFPGSKTFKIVQYLEADLIKLHTVLVSYESISKDVSGNPSPFKSFYKDEYAELVSRFVEYGWFKKELKSMYGE